MKREFGKFFIASLKRTAMNVSPLVRRKQKLQAEIAEKEVELQSVQAELDTYEAPIKEATGGYGTEDLVVRTVEVTDKVDKDGKPVKVTKWNLRYPDTIVPLNEDTEESIKDVVDEHFEEIMEESKESFSTVNTIL